MNSASTRALTEWVVSVAAPAALRRLGCPEEAEVLENLGPGPFTMATARVVLAKNVEEAPEAAARKRVAMAVIAAVEVYDRAPTVAFQEPLVKQAEALAREVGALAGMAWSGGGEA